jgi:Fur family transcriptional regulator, ferric uptake regulator
MAHGGEIDWASAARASLSQAGHRAGGAREAVVALLARQTCCVSAQDISDGLRDGGTDVGIASIYRALDLLHEMGLVQRVEFGEGPARYEPVVPGGDHHHHAVCDHCGRVTAFEDDRLERQLERLAGRLDHSMSAHDIVIHGSCARCAGGSRGR